MAKTGDTGGRHRTKGRPSEYMRGMGDGRSHMHKANSLGPPPSESDGEGPHKTGGWVTKLSRGQKHAK